MSEMSARLDLPYLQPAQAQKHITHNEAIERLDLLVQLTVQAFGAQTPPPQPQEGEIWALGPSPTESWAGQPNMLAAWSGQGWIFVAPQPGWRAAMEADLRVWTGSDWARPPLQDPQNLAGLGVNAGFDATNRLSVSAPATLFSHEGTDHRLKINKAGAGDTASLLFQTGWSGRAEMGTTGDDDLAFRVSAGGTGWLDALKIDRNTGRATMLALSVGEIIGDAVTQSATDATAGRVPINRPNAGGIFGLGNVANLPELPDLNDNMTPSGEYRAVSSTVNRGDSPYGDVFFTLAIHRIGDTSCLQVLRRSDSDPVYMRFVTSGGAGDWKEVYDTGNTEIGSNSNGTFVRWPNGVQECWRVATHDYNSDSSQTHDFPAAFDTSFDIVVSWGSADSASPDFDLPYERRFIVTLPTTKDFWRTRAPNGSPVDEQVGKLLYAVGRWT